MATVICPKCGLKVRAEDGECFACGARLPRPRIEPEEYYEPAPRQSPARQTPPTQQPEYQRTGYTQNNAIPNYNNTGTYQNTSPVGNYGGIPQGSIPARESTQAYSGQTYTRDTLPPPPPITPPPVASSSSTSTVSTTTKQSTPKPEKLKNSTLSIVAFILSILIFPVGLILGIVDLAKKDKTHKHGFSVAAIVIAGLMVIYVAGRSGESNNTLTKEEAPAATESVAVEAEEAEEAEEPQAQEETAHVEESTPVEEEPSEKASPADDAPNYEQTDAHVEYYTDSIGSIKLYAFVEIENKGNSGLYLDKCTFDFEDNEGHLLQSEKYISTCPDIVAPGEKGYFYYSGLLNDGVSTDNGVNLVPNYKVELAKGDITEYEVSDTELKEGSLGEPVVTGRVTNNTDQDDSYCYVNIIFYDANGKVLALTGTSITDLTAGSTVSFDCSAFFITDSVTISDIADYKVLARKGYMQF